MEREWKSGSRALIGNEIATDLSQYWIKPEIRSDSAESFDIYGLFSLSHR